MPGSGLVLAADLASELVTKATDLKLKKSEISFSIKLPDGTLIEHLPTQSRAPASCMKLAVAAACLDLLGPDHKLDTQLMGLGKVEEGVLEGDLIVIGGGDPAICGRENETDPLWELRPWIREIRGRGIDRIRGRILADVRYLEGPGIHPDWPKDQLSRWYCAPSGALNLNDNCIDLLIGPVVSGKVQIEIKPPQPLLSVKNSLIPCALKKDHLYRIDRKGNGWEVEVTGKFLETGGVRTSWVAVPDPADNFVSIFLQMVRDAGIAVEGVALSPAEIATPIASIQHTLSSRLPVMLKNSQNLYADALFRVLARKRGGNGSFSSASSELAGWLRNRLGAGDEVVIRDGSGLSRENRLTAALLRRIVELGLSSSWSQPLFDSLPLSGVDGTLAKRMTSSPLKGLVRAKTGTIRGVVSLAGVIDCEQGQVPFCFLYQGRSGRTAQARDWQDRSLMAVFQVVGDLKALQN